MGRLSVLGLMSAIVVLGSGTAAIAKLPPLRSGLIVPAKSIGGLALGGTVAQAEQI
jgi:hypothetical protein